MKTFKPLFIGYMVLLSGIGLQAMQYEQKPTSEGEELYQKFSQKFDAKGNEHSDFKAVRANLDVPLEKVYWSLKCVNQKESDSFVPALNNLQVLIKELKLLPRESGESVETKDSRWMHMELRDYVRIFRLNLLEKQKATERK